MRVSEVKEMSLDGYYKVDSAWYNGSEDGVPGVMVYMQCSVG